MSDKYYYKMEESEYGEYPLYRGDHKIADVWSYADAKELMRVLALAHTAELVAQMDDEAVDRFAQTMKEKMALARMKGRGGWEDPRQCTIGELQEMLAEHVKKGDPVDVANFCMMLYHRGGRT